MPGRSLQARALATLVPGSSSSPGLRGCAALRLRCGTVGDTFCPLGSAQRGRRVASVLRESRREGPAGHVSVETGPGLFALGALSHGSFPVPFTSRGPGKKVCSCLLPPQRWSSLDGPRPGTKLPPVTSIPDSFGGFCVFPFPSAAVAFCH